MIRILVVEDSTVVAMLLRAILEAEPDLQVVGHARDGREAVRMTHDLKPDLITMDIRMPVMDGFDATRMIMANDPTPIVVVSSSVDDEELRITFRAIEEGALAVIEKPPGFGHPDFAHIREQLVETVRAMAEVRVIRRRQRPAVPHRDIFEVRVPRSRGTYELVAIGCSTGGPQALRVILSALPVGFPLPILVVQHISPGFVGGMVEWLRGQTLLDVRLAGQGETLLPATVFVAPDDNHLEAHREGGRLVTRLAKTPPVSRFRPSATPLLESTARCCGPRAIGALLTGMGNDGAQGLLRLREAGGHTFVQDQQSSVVFGMPGAALALGAATDAIPLERIAEHLNQLARQ